MSLKKPFDIDLAKQAFGERFVRPPPARYYYTRDKVSGKYRIVDRQLHRGMVIALSDFREAAVLIATALNQSLKQEKAIEPATASPPAFGSGRTAVLGDILECQQYSSPFWVRGLDTDFGP